MNQKEFRKVWLFRSALLLSFLTFIPLNVLYLSECSGLLRTIRVIQNPLTFLGNIFPILLTGLAAWLTRSTAVDAKPLKFVLRHIAVPLFVVYGILGLYISDMLCYSNVISNQLVNLYVDGWLSEIVNYFLLGLFLGTIYGLSIPLLRRGILSGYSRLQWVISGEKPKIRRIHMPINHNNSLFLGRAAVLSVLMPLVLSFTTPIYQDVTSNPPGVALYFFNLPLQISLIVVPMLVVLGESLSLTFDRVQPLSHGYFRWLLASLSLGGIASFVFSLSKFHPDLNGVEFLAKPVTSAFLMFVGASAAVRFSLALAEWRFDGKRILVWISAVGMLLSVLFLVETNFAVIFLNSSFFGTTPNPWLVAWSEMLFVTEPITMVSTYLSASTFIYVLSFFALVLFYYRRTYRPNFQVRKIVPSILLAVLIFVYQWGPPNGGGSIWRSFLCSVISYLLAYSYLGTDQFRAIWRALGKAFHSQIRPSVNT